MSSTATFHCSCCLQPSYVCHKSHKPGQGVRLIVAHAAKHQLQEKEKIKPPVEFCGINIHPVYTHSLEFLGEVEQGWGGFSEIGKET